MPALDFLKELRRGVKKSAASGKPCPLLGEAGRLISLLDEPNQRQVLGLYYIKALDWEAVALLLGYTKRSLYRIRDSAVERLERLSGDGAPRGGQAPGE
jgi:hypothetical protein